MEREEMREIIEDACHQQVTFSNYGGPKKAVSTERASDILRRVVENLPSEMTIGELSEVVTKGLCTGYNPGSDA